MSKQKKTDLKKILKSPPSQGKPNPSATPKIEAITPKAEAIINNSVSLFLLTPKTNLHAGSGSSNYGVIDNLVQRDEVDDYPNIHSSSLKGAFREYFEEYLVKIKKSIAQTMVETIFGDSNVGKGQYSFYDAHLLALPVRSNKKPFFMATCPYLIDKLIQICADYKYSLDSILSSQLKLLKELPGQKPVIIGNNIADLKVEDFSTFTFNGINTSHLAKIFGKDIVLFSNEDFQYQCSDYALPVVPRNQLENGESKNLWYEQIIPRETRFFFFTERQTSIDTFEPRIHDQIVQIGANATIGYGRCKVQNIAKL